MSSKAKPLVPTATVEAAAESEVAEEKLEDHPFVSARFKPVNAHQQNDPTTKLAWQWRAKRLELVAARQATFGFCSVKADGTVEIVDKQDFETAQEGISRLATKIDRYEQAIRQIIKADPEGRFMFQLEEEKGRYDTEEGHRGELKRLFEDLSRWNDNHLYDHHLSPEELLKLPEYKDAKTRFEQIDAENQPKVDELMAIIQKYQEALAVLEVS